MRSCVQCYINGRKTRVKLTETRILLYNKFILKYVVLHLYLLKYMSIYSEMNVNFIFHIKLQDLNYKLRRFTV